MIEETPAPNLPDGMAQALCSAAIALGKAVNYRSAGTVEFVYDSAAQRFYFLEVNTRLQVEHGVTEQVGRGHGALDDRPGGRGFTAAERAGRRATTRGHAIQARIYAEDPAASFSLSRTVNRRLVSTGGRRHPAHRSLGGGRVRCRRFRPAVGESYRLAPQPR